MATETLKIKYIKDVDGNRIIPVTHEDAVFDSEGVNISSKYIKGSLKSDTKSSLTASDMGSTNNRQYAVGLDTNGALSVNVPWQEFTAGTGLNLTNSVFSLTSTYQNYCSYANKLNTFYEGVNTATSVSSIPVTKRLCVITIGANGSLTLKSVPGAGREIHIIIVNSSTSDITITMPTASTYVNLSGDSITVPASGYAEVNIISNGSKMYIRAV